MTLEQKLARLDELSKLMDSEISLEKSLEIFEESVKLANECMTVLEDCKGKLVVLQQKVAKITDEK